MILPGRATVAGTRRFFDRLRRSFADVRDPHWFCNPPGTGLLVSRVGFGTYRVHRDQTEHHEAMREAILSGCNVIDTAPNYSDGSAEILTGNVIQELDRARRLERDEVVLIGKVGFIEESSLHLLVDRMPHETVEIGPSLYHSIHPDFIEMQFEWSRQRLGVETIDVFLLHNPEVCLTAGRTSETDYLRRMRNALNHLEDLRSRGLISFYGVSSNELPTDEGLHHLGAILSFAPPGFRVIEFPANLLETGYRETDLLALAKRQALWTIGHRPLNAIPPRGPSVIRLARMVERPPEGEDNPEERQLRMEEELRHLERSMLELCNEHKVRFAFAERSPSAAETLQYYRDRIPGPEDIYPLIQALTPPLQQTVSRLKIALDDSSDPRRGRLLFERYVRLIHSALASFPAYQAHQNDRRMEGLEAWGRKEAGLDYPLAVLAVQAVLAEGVDTVLVGMRRVSYVRQIKRVATLPVLRKIPVLPETLLPEGFGP